MLLRGNILRPPCYLCRDTGKLDRTYISSHWRYSNQHSADANATHDNSAYYHIQDKDQTTAEYSAGEDVGKVYKQLSSARKNKERQDRATYRALRKNGMMGESLSGFGW